VSENRNHLLGNKNFAGQEHKQVTLEVFFDAQGLVHYEFIPEGSTVSKECMPKSSFSSGMQREVKVIKIGRETAGFSYKNTRLHIGRLF
jgi:hypothetical protein